MQVRNELLLNADPLTGRAALRLGNLKLLRSEPPSAWGPDPRLGERDLNRSSLVAAGPDVAHWARQLGVRLPP